MSIVRSLAVALGLKGQDQFSRGLKKARKEVRNFADGFPLLNRRVSELGVYAAGAAVGGMAYMTRQAMKAIDQNAKLADVIGISVEALQGFQLAADISGVSQDQLNVGIKTFLKNMKDATYGLATYTRAFDELGLSANTLAKMDTGGALVETLDALGKIPKQSDRAAVALNIFGRSGIHIAKLAHIGREGFRRFADELDRMGVLIGRIDSAKVEAANDAVTRLRRLWDGLYLQLAVKVAPVIEAIATKFIEIGTEGESVGERVERAFQAIQRVVETLISSFEILKGTFWTFVGGVQIGAAKIFRSIEWLSKKVPGLGFMKEEASDVARLYEIQGEKNVARGLEGIRSGSFGQGARGFANMLDSVFRAAQAAAEAAVKAKQSRVGNAMDVDGAVTAKYTAQQAVLRNYALGGDAFMRQKNEQRMADTRAHALLQGILDLLRGMKVQAFAG